MVAGAAAAGVAEELGIRITRGAALAGHGHLGRRVVRSLAELEELARFPNLLKPRRMYRSHEHPASRSPDPTCPCLFCGVRRVPQSAGDITCARCKPLSAALRAHPWDALPFDWAAWLGDEALVERWEERAAVMEFEGGLSQLEAERSAFFGIWCELAEPDPDLDEQIAELEVAWS